MTQRKLLPGGRVAIVAPSGTISNDYLLAGVEVLRSAGFVVEVMPHVSAGPSGVFSASDEDRAADLALALSRPDVDAVWCTRGGYGAMRTLQGLPSGIFQQTDKILVGFSDITVLHAMAERSGHVGLLAPMLKHLATHGLQSPDVQETLAILRGEPVAIACNARVGSRNGSVSARVVGGNLSIIHSLRGTPAESDYRGKILFIEDLCEYRYHIDRMIQNLRFSGVLQGLAGLIVGQMTDMKDGATPFGRDAYQIVADAVADYDYPVLLGFPSGHAPEENHPLLIGGEATLSVNGSSASLAFAPF